MAKKWGGAGEKQPRSEIKRPSLTQGESVSLTTESQPHQAQQQLISSTTAETTNLGTRPQQESTTSEQSARHQRSSTQPRHQVIAVSASKGPAAFFNLARKFLVTDEFCDLSALEGAIVSAVDAAHLLERSKLADIIRIQTSYVPVEPKRRPQQDSSKQSGVTAPVAIAPASSSTTPVSKLQREDQPTSSKRLHQGRKGAPLRRSRIIITVKRTDDYKQWLEANPHLATGHGDDIDDSPT